MLTGSDKAAVALTPSKAEALNGLDRVTSDFTPEKVWDVAASGRLTEEVTPLNTSGLTGFDKTLTELTPSKEGAVFEAGKVCLTVTPVAELDAGADTGAGITAGTADIGAATVIAGIAMVIIIGEAVKKTGIAIDMGAKDIPLNKTLSAEINAGVIGKVFWTGAGNQLVLLTPLMELAGFIKVLQMALELFTLT